MIGLLILMLVALAVVFWVGLAFWVRKDARLRASNPSRVGVATCVGLVPCLGPVVYLLLRPTETRDEARSRKTGIAALEAHLRRGRHTCPECSAPAEADFLVCAVCTTRLRKPCVDCDAPLERLWQMCPYCATPVEAQPDLDVPLTRELRSTRARDVVTRSATPQTVKR